MNAGKDAWNNHYEKTEAELREKSDASSNHVQDVQARTSQARSMILNSQSSLDSLLEGHRRSEERHALSEQADLSNRCQQNKEFETTFSDQFQSFGHALKTFVDEELKQDKPTGHTPLRVDRTFPKKLVKGTPDETRLRNFRDARDVSRVAFSDIQNMIGIGEDGDADSVVSKRAVYFIYGPK